MQFRQPSVNSLEPPELFFAVAEAAEKYIVYGAMNTFLTRMECLVNIRPIEVLNHAYKHGYPGLADKAAYCSLKEPLKDIASGLTHPGLVAKWLAYYDCFYQIVLHVDNSLAPTLAAKCPTITQAYADYSRAVNSDITAASKPPEGLCPNSYNCACRSLNWVRLTQKVQAKQAAIPKFSQVAI